MRVMPGSMLFIFVVSEKRIDFALIKEIGIFG